MTPAIYRFGDFQIDLAARELYRAGLPVALPPKSFDCLGYLIAHRERAVGRDELISAVWGRVDVNDALLAQTLLRARRAVGDAGSRQDAIRTVPRFGYRWIAPVDAVTDAAVPPHASAEHASAAPAAGVRARATTRNRRRFLAAAAGALLLAAIAAVIVLDRRGGGSAAPPAGTQPLAVVMPVDVAGSDAENAWIRLGAMDYIAARLRDGGLSVLPSEQVVALVGSAGATGADTVARIARATGARWIVLPSARRAGTGWSVRLRDGSGDDAHETEATAATPLQAAAGASAQLLAAWGRRTPPATPSGAAPTALTERVQRVDAAMLGGDLAEARRLLDGATPDQRADPTLRVREGQLDFRAGGIDDAERIFAALAGNDAPLPAAVRAQALMGLGAVAVRRNDFAPAEKRYAEALAVLGDSGDANLVGLAYTGRGVARGAQGTFDLALADFGRARVALERAGNPLDAASVETDLGLVEGSRRRYAQALAPFDRAIATFERFDVRDNLAASLLGKARAQLALLDLDGALASSGRAWELARALENPVLVRNIDLARAEALLDGGRLREAAAIIDRLPGAGGADDDELPRLRALLALARGDAHAALATLAPVVDRSAGPPAALLPLFVTAAVRAGDTAAARRAVERERTSAAAPGDAFAIELARGELAAAGGDHGAAEARLRSAVAHADAGGVPAERARAACAYARQLIAAGKLDQASAVVGELAPYADRDFRVAQVTAALFHALGERALGERADARLHALAGERRVDVPVP